MKEHPDIKRLPHFQGLPIPWTVILSRSGIPDFKVIDEPKRLRCLHEHLCGICSKHLGYGKRIAFIGGTQSAQSGIFVDPPMHVHCAQFSLATCPFLTKTDKVYSQAGPHTPDNSLIVTDHTIAAPTRSCIYITKGFSLIAGTRYIQAEKPIAIEWQKEK